MKEAVIMTKEEYENINKMISNLKIHLMNEKGRRIYNEVRSNTLWEALNRPAIEAAAQKHEDEFLDWCAEKADEYEKKDFDEWVLKKSKFYNNGRYQFCKDCGITEEGYEQYVRYDEWRPVITPNKTEGWSDVRRNRIGRSWILHYAQADVYERYEKTKQEDKEKAERYWDLWMTFMDMKEESERIDPDYGGFFR